MLKAFGHPNSEQDTPPRTCKKHMHNFAIVSYCPILPDKEQIRSGLISLAIACPFCATRAIVSLGSAPTQHLFAASCTPLPPRRFATRHKQVPPTTRHCATCWKQALPSPCRCATSCKQVTPPTNTSPCPAHVTLPRAASACHPAWCFATGCKQVPTYHTLL